MSTSNTSKSGTPEAQIDKFRDLARDLECDEDEKRFEETVRRVAKPDALGSWEVRPLKDQSGFYSRFTPDSYGPQWDGPAFATREEVYSWLAQHGRRQSADDPDKWRN